MSRPSCIICTGKHLATAARYYDEFKHGYEEFIFYVIGELEHAWMECEQELPSVSAEIYGEKKNFENDPDGYEMDLHPLISRLARLWNHTRRERQALEEAAGDVDDNSEGQEVHPTGAEEA